MAASRLFTLLQGFQSAAEYSIEFWILAAETGWNEPALMNLFKRGLSDKRQDELAAREGPDTLERPISLMIKLDNHKRETERKILQ